METAIDDAIDNDLPSECANVLHDNVFHTHFDVFRRVVLRKIT